MQQTLSLLFGAIVALSLTGTAARATDYSLEALTIEQSWARASAGPARNSAAFMTIRNSGPADRLIAATGDVAGRVELHIHLMEGNVMKMRQVEAVEIPQGGTASLEPGGYHVMLIGLKAPLAEGGSFPLTLTFEKAGTITIEVPVQAVGSLGPQGGMPGQGMHGQGMPGHGMGPGSMNHGTMPQSN